MSSVVATERKLAELWSWMYSARQLRRLRFYRASRVFAYTRDLASGLVGLGLGFPLQGVIAEGASVGAALADMPLALQIFTAGGAVAWVGFKVVVQNQDLERRAALARTCMQRFRGFEMRLNQSVNQHEPLPLLAQIHADLLPVLDQATHEEIWPWDEFAPGAFELGSKRAAEVAARLGQQWVDVPQERRPIESQELPETEVRH